MSLRYTVTRIPRNSSYGIFRERNQFPWQRLDMVLCHFFHKPELTLDMVLGYFSYKIHYYSFHTRDMFHISFLINLCPHWKVRYRFPPTRRHPKPPTPETEVIYGFKSVLWQNILFLLPHSSQDVYYFLFFSISSFGGNEVFPPLLAGLRLQAFPKSFTIPETEVTYGFRSFVSQY